MGVYMHTYACMCSTYLLKAYGIYIMVIVMPIHTFNICHTKLCFDTHICTYIYICEVFMCYAVCK